MTIPAEHLYESCTCLNGMRDGLRCADCNGRGIVPKGVKPTGAVIADEAGDSTVDDGLEDLSIVHLRSRAKDLGLSAGGSKDALVARIRETESETDEDTEATETDEGSDAGEAS